MEKLSRLIGAAVCLLCVCSAEASHHGWRVVEAFSNADGTLQFIEMEALGTNENNITCCQLVAGDLTTKVDTLYSFPFNLSSSAVGDHLLLATGGFEAAFGIAPDFFIPDGFLATTAGDAFYNNSLNWPSLPTDGVNSYATDGVIAAATPTNLAGLSVTLTAPETPPPVVNDYDGDGIDDAVDDDDDGDGVLDIDDA